MSNTKRNLKAHRGRFQAQGKKLEKSVSWAQDDPLTIAQAEEALSKLELKLTLNQCKQREDALKKCREMMNSAHSQGGIDADRMGKIFSKSFPPNSMERIDVEVHKGKAFVQ